MTRSIRTAFAVAVFSLVSLSGFAQDYPMPVPVGSPPALCATCSGVYTNKPTAQFAPPIKNHTGRFLDGNGVKAWQSTPRTLRAKGVWIAPERDRVYVHFGASRFASYKLSTFFASDLARPMVEINRNFQGATKEKYQDWYGHVDAEALGSGWTTSTIDGQDRFSWFDWDDRDNIYLAYGPYGWGIVKDGSGLMPLVQGSQLKGFAGVIVSLKANNKYYAVLIDSATTSRVYDVTNVSNPQLLRNLTLGGNKYARTASGDRIALVDSTGVLRIWRTADFILNGQPEATIQPRSGSMFKDVDSDGTRFFAVEYGSDASLSIISPSAGFNEVKHPIGSFNPFTIRYGFGYVSMLGSDASGSDVKVLRVSGTTPENIDLHDFFSKYYFQPDAGFAIPGNSLPRQVLVHKQGGKEYLIYSGNSMGDVFELQTRPTIQVSLDTSRNWGTPNTYSKKKNDGPFYGDKVPLKSSFDGTATILWNFGNPEAPTANTMTGTTGEAFTYQYSGLTSSALISPRKTVKAHEVLDPTNNDEMFVQMSVPEIRIGIRSLLGSAQEILFTQPNASSSAPIVFGDEFVDASDGVVQGHTSNWTLDGAPSTLSPNVPLSAGPCGPHSVSFQARYGPAGDYLAPLSPMVIGYDVRPFVAGIALASFNASTVTFNNSTSRFSAIATSANPAWELLDTNSVVLQQGSLASFTINKPAPAGGSVRLTLTVPSVGDPGCSAAQFLTSVATFKLNPPDPKITESGTCQYTGPGCTLTAGSVSGADQTSWTYQWFVDNSNSPAGTGKNFSPNIAATGQHTVRVEATNAFGVVPATKLLNLQTPPCGAAPKKSSISIDFSGVNTGCTTCSQNEPLRFSVYAFTGYAFQDCDTFVWNWGDGTPNTTEQDPVPVVHTFPGSGPYTVKLTVSNSSGSATTDPVTVQFGAAPPPPPPPPPACDRAAGYVDITFTGNQGCNTGNSSCKAGEQITFSGGQWGRATTPNCWSFSWNFGDGTTSSSRTPTKTYNSSGNKTVTLTITGGGGNISGPITFSITGDTPPPPPPPGTCQVKPSDYIDFSYLGGTTGCDGSGTDCSRTEAVQFTVDPWTYVIADCDTFTWNWDDGSANTVGNGLAGKNATHTFAGAKASYDVALTASNSKGNITVRHNVRFAGSGVAAPNNVSLQGASSGVINVPMSFSATATAPDNGPITAWVWNFGDNTAVVTTPSSSTTHTYTRAGTFNLSVSARNVGGTSAPAGKSITITDGVQFAFMLPVVAHVSGRNGTVWRTDLHVFDPNHTVANQPLRLNAEFGRINKELQITSSTFVLEDFMTFFKDQDDAGPVVIRGVAGKPPQIWTRTYNRTATGGSYGQLIPAVAMNTSGGDLVTEDSAYIAAGVRHGNGRRTNIGVVSLSPIPTEVRIIAYDDRLEIPIGEFTQSLEPFHLVQIGNIDQFIPNLPLRPFSVKFVSSLAVPIMAYASEVDNLTGDPRFIAAARESSYSSENYRQQILPLIGPSSEWKTDATIFNLEGTTLQVTMAYFDASGNRMKESQVSINARSFVQVEDVMQRQLSLSGTTGGFVRVEVNGTPAKNPIVMGATYKLKEGGGAYGQGFSALPVGSPNVKQNKPAYIAGVKNDSQYMTNIGLVNSGNDAALVTVRLLDKDSGAEIDSWLYALNGNQSVVRNIFEVMENAATAGTLKIEVTGGSVWAFASMVAKGTGDPELIPAVAGQ